MEDELIRIGSGRSRGLGQIKAEVSLQEKNGHPGGITTSTIRGSAEPTHELWGLGRWLNDRSYGTWTDDSLPLAQAIERRDHGIRSQRVFSGNAMATLRDATIDHFIKRMQEWPVEVRA